jgi:hypothetical protein
MRRLQFLTFFLLICNLANGQTPKEDSIKTAIIKLSAEWNEALVNRDSATLERILSSDFTLSSLGGSLLPRKEWLTNSLHGLVTDSAAFIGAQKITVYGNEAISEAVLHWKVRNTNKDGRVILRNNENLVADIWRLNDGRWQVVHRISKILRKR